MRWGSLIACCLIASVARGAEALAPARIDHLVRAYMEREHIPGVAVVALRGDRVILAQGWGYAVFGKVVGGSDVVDRIKAVKTGRKGFHDDVPK